MKLLILFLMFFNGYKNPEITVDLVVYEHNYDKDGIHLYDQLIFLKKDPYLGYVVRDFYLVPYPKSMLQIYYKRGKYHYFLITRSIKSKDILFTIKTKIYREVIGYLGNDTEKLNKQILPEKERDIIFDVQDY